jgi:hypothetical protein
LEVNDYRVDHTTTNLAPGVVSVRHCDHSLNRGMRVKHESEHLKFVAFADKKHVQARIVAVGRSVSHRVVRPPLVQGA